MNNPPNQTIFPITGTVFSEPYNWGGYTYIPHLLGFEAVPGKPYAEYWLGTHPKGPAEVTMLDGSTETLENLIKNNADIMLGPISDRFSNLPFLFKLLDAREMLSLQVHPNKKQAEEGFERDEKSGIPFSDPKRTYKDDNHKPEFAVAQSDFWLLHGFRSKESLQQLLSEVPEFSSFVSIFQDGDHRKLYQHVMLDLSVNEANTILSSLAKRILPAYSAQTLEKSNPDYWAAKAIEYMEMTDGNYDRGLFSIYFLNLVNMKPGQALFQDAGLIHAYLEGSLVEIMANSDNVARAGLTSKFVDLAEIMKLVTFEGITPNVVNGKEVEMETFYDAPIDEFAVSSILFTNNQMYKHASTSPEILIGMNGNAEIMSNGTKLSLAKGKSVFIPAGVSYEITGDASADVYRTSVPIKKDHS